VPRSAHAPIPPSCSPRRIWIPRESGWRRRRAGGAAAGRGGEEAGEEGEGEGRQRRGAGEGGARGAQERDGEGSGESGRREKVRVWAAGGGYCKSASQGGFCEDGSIIKFSLLYVEINISARFYVKNI